MGTTQHSIENSGFSLMEMAVVLAVTAAMTVAVVPSLVETAQYDVADTHVDTVLTMHHALKTYYEVQLNNGNVSSTADLFPDGCAALASANVIAQVPANTWGGTFNCEVEQIPGNSFIGETHQVAKLTVTNVPADMMDYLKSQIPLTSCAGSDCTSTIMPPNAQIISGCTDSAACNYNVAASQDDGSCWSANPGCACTDGENAVEDECGTCGGSGAAIGGCCPGVVLDACGVCGGDNSTCAGCDGVPNSGAVMTACGCGELPPDPQTLCCASQTPVIWYQDTDCDGLGDSGTPQVPYCAGTTQPDGPYCFALNDNDSQPNCATNNTDACGVCAGDNSSCAGCDGVPNSGLVDDACGVCGGNGSSCMGCDGVSNSGLVNDACGVCDGDGSSCADCNNEPYGNAYTDNCNQCVGGSTGQSACVQDCNNDWGGTAQVDSCGGCYGGNTSLGLCDACGSHASVAACFGCGVAFNTCSAACGGGHSCNASCWGGQFALNGQNYCGWLAAQGYTNGGPPPPPPPSR